MINEYMRKSFLLVAGLFLSLSEIPAQTPQWPEAGIESKAGSRWWLMGSAVDQQNLVKCMDDYAKAGIGTLEITPIYGVQGNQNHALTYLSNDWMDALKSMYAIGQEKGIDIDMNNGTGWPFGGPTVSLADAASKLVWTNAIVQGDGETEVSQDISASESGTTLSCVMAYPQGETVGSVMDVTEYVDGKFLRWKAPSGSWRIIAVYNGHTMQKVKRAAPGGEGYVLDHFNGQAVQRYLSRFDSAFVKTNTPWPKSFFNDSYEVFNADWSPVLFEEFERYRGYRLQEHMDKLLGYADDVDNKVLSDYRETLSDMLLNNFVRPWTAWAHSHGVKTRNQAHGSPGNLLDLYGAVDIPEIEGFGLTDFGIRGLRTDAGFTRSNYSDFTVLKYASSAAHVMGRPFCSSETFTWLTEHFRTSLSQMKPDLDLMFCAGVNHMFFHGTTYSPEEAAWPGWKFYAAVDMSPTNSIWRDAPYLLKYIERCQSFLQMGSPDNDFLVYAPFRQAWHKGKKQGAIFNTRMLTFPIDEITRKLPEFTKCVNNIIDAGYDGDYISDRQLLNTRFVDGMLQTEGNTRYRALVVPVKTDMPESVQVHLDSLSALGATIVYADDAGSFDGIAGARPEEMRTKLGLKVIRRTNDKGHHYFISNLTGRAVADFVSLGVDFSSAYLFDPMTGSISRAVTKDGKVYVELASGQSVILQTESSGGAEDSVYPAYAMESKAIDAGWKLMLPDEQLERYVGLMDDVPYQPATVTTYDLGKPMSWENLDEKAGSFAGTGIYTTTFEISPSLYRRATGGFRIDLGDVRESARVFVNDRFVGCAWALPYVVDCGDAVVEGTNTLRVEVTNLPANRIRQMDIDGRQWRIFEDVNILDISKGNIGVSGITSYADWKKMPSGLNSEVRLIPMRKGALELKAELIRMEPATEERDVYYPVYRLQMTDGSAIKGTDEVIVKELAEDYVSLSATTADGTDYAIEVPARGGFFLKHYYDFTSETEPGLGWNNPSSSVLNGFAGSFSSRQAKGPGTEVSGLYDGLVFKSALTNFYYFYPTYGMNMLRDCDVDVTVKAYDVIVLSSLVGDAGNTTVYHPADSLTACASTLDDGIVSLPLTSRKGNVVYRSIGVYSPLNYPIPSAIYDIREDSRKEPSSQNHVYNIQGQRIAEGSDWNSVPKGIYIFNRKKIVK